MSDPTNRPLRVLQVFNRYLHVGGEEQSVARMAQDLESAGHQVARFWRESAEWQGLEAPPRWKQPSLLWRNLAVLRELEALHMKTQPDLWLLHNVLPVISLGVYPLANRLRVPIVQWLHNYRPISPSGTLFAGRRKLAPDERWIGWKEMRAGTWHGLFLTAWLALGYARLRQRGDFAAVRAWVAISEEMKTVFARAGWFPERLHALRHSWHLRSQATSETDCAWKAGFPNRTSDGYFLFLGRLVEAKGVRFLVDLWRQPALQAVPLVIAGEGELAEELRSDAPPNIRWTGLVKGEVKEALLAGCRGVLVPGLWEEPLGIVAYEAYEARKPVLASNLGGIREVVTDGLTGYLLPPGDPVAWTKGLLQLDAARAQQLGLAGRKWLEENTSPSAWNRRFEEIVRRAIAPSLRSADILSA